MLTYPHINDHSVEFMRFCAASARSSYKNILNLTYEEKSITYNLGDVFGNHKELIEEAFSQLEDRVKCAFDSVEHINTLFMIWQMRMMIYCIAIFLLAKMINYGMQ